MTNPPCVETIKFFPGMLDQQTGSFSLIVRWHTIRFLISCGNLSQRYNIKYIWTFKKSLDIHIINIYEYNINIYYWLRFPMARIIRYMFEAKKYPNFKDLNAYSNIVLSKSAYFCKFCMYNFKNY